MLVCLDGRSAEWCLEALTQATRSLTVSSATAALLGYAVAGIGMCDDVSTDSVYEWQDGGVVFGKPSSTISISDTTISNSSADKVLWLALR